MKCVLTILSLFLLQSAAFSQSYRAVTYNLRLDVESDGINRWDNRKEWITRQINTIAPDVMGIQEGLPHQVSYLDSVLTEYHYVGVGREDGAKKGEYSAIFFSSQKFKLLEQGTFWLSDTPGVVSTGWDAALPRICTYAILEDITDGQPITVFNTHFDHMGEIARFESAKLILEKARLITAGKVPFLLMGDLNAEPDTSPIKVLTDHIMDAQKVSISDPEGPNGTFNGFDTSHPLDYRIDYIFVSHDIKVNTYQVINEVRQNRTPSDHLPVVVNFSILEP